MMVRATASNITTTPTMAPVRTDGLGWSTVSIGVGDCVTMDVDDATGTELSTVDEAAVGLMEVVLYRS